MRVAVCRHYAGQLEVDARECIHQRFLLVKRASKEESWTAALQGARVRYPGPAALTEDDSVRSKATTLVNMEAGYRFSDR